MATLLGVLPASLVPAANAAVPTAPANAAVISVKVGGDRLADGTVKGLPGVTLALYGPGTASSATGTDGATQGAAGTRYDYSWATCTSDADGDCNFTVPIRAGAISATGAPQDTRFWVVQVSSAAGWYANPRMRLGGFAATPEFTWDYRFRTDSQLRAGTTYRSTTPLPVRATVDDWNATDEPDRGFMRNREDSNAEGGRASNIGRTTGVWSQSRTNPVFPAMCGLNVAIVTDTSGSLGAAGMAEVKSAMGSFVDAFRGTPTSMSLFSFATSSPGNSATNHPALLPVTTAAQADTFKAQYASWAPSGGTNWDRGLAAAANSGSTYDLVILLTDGNPTVMATPNQFASAYNSFQDVDAGIFSANQLKASGARVVAVGAGPAITAESELNLRAISGVTKGSDYFRTTNFAEAADVLSALAKATCQGSIQVQKMIVPPGGTIADATPAPAGWQFAASTTASGVSIAAPATASTTADSDGKVDFGLAFTSPVTSGAVQVLETQQAGYQVVPVGSGADARNAVCTDTTTGNAVSVTDAGTTANPGFTVDGKSGTQILCKIYNTKPLTPGNLVVEKTSDPASGTAVSFGDFIDYTVTFKNTGEQPVAVDHTDHLADMVDDGTLVGGPTSSNAALTVTTLTGPDRFRIVGSVPAGASYTVKYRFQVKPAGSTFGDGSLDNFVTKTGTNPPSTCDESTKLCTTHPIPGKLVMKKSSNPASGTALNPGQSATYTLSFQNSGASAIDVDHDDVLTDVLDDANISNIATSNAALTANLSGNRLSITGSVPAGATYTVTYTVTVPDPVKAGGNGVLNNYLVPDGVTPPPTCVESTELCTTHPIPGRLVLKKSSSPASGTALNPGQSATYTLSFQNSGASAIDVDHDDVLTDVLDDANISNIATSNAALTANLSGNRLSITGSVPAGATYTVTYTVTVPDPVKAGGNGVLNNYLVPDGVTPPPTCVESTELCTTHPIPGDVTVDKAVSGYTSPLKLGDIVTYTLTFTHSGGLSAPINYDDNLADVLDDATLVSGPTSSSLAATATLTGTAPNQRIQVQGTISKGAPITVTYQVKVKSSSLGNGTLDNCVAEPAPGTDQDCTSTPIPGKLEFKKTSDPVSGTAVLRGDSINYTLTFSNTGGKPMTVKHTDVLTELLDDATITAGPTATGGLTVTPSPLGSATSFDIDGELAGGATATVTYTAKVKTTGLGDGVLDNFLVKEGDTPPEECVPTAGQDPTCTTHPVPSSLTVTKTSDPVSTTPVEAGQVLTYTLTFANGGGTPASVDHTDSLAKVLDDADLVAGSLTAQSGLNAALATDGQSFRVTGNVPGGETLTVTYQVKVKDADFGDGRLDNFVRTTGTTPPATCEPGDALCTTHPVPPKLSVVKDSTPADGTVVALGSLVSYTLTFTNTGGTAAPVNYTDDLSKALDDATVEGQPTIAGNAYGLTASSVSGGKFTVTGDLTAGETVQVTYTLRVKTTDLGDGVLTNVVVKTGDTPPPTCVTGDPLCTEHPVAGKLTVVKSSDPADGSTVAPGSDVDYTLTFSNTGGLATPVDYTDYLAELLDDATITADPESNNPALTVNPSPLGNADKFTVSGSVPAGKTITVKYTATVKTSGFGDGKLTNVVVEGDEPPGPCVVGDPLCTEHPVGGKLKVVKTSDPASGEVAPAGSDVTYTLTFENTGGSTIAVDQVDSLAGVLDDAELVSGPTAQAPLTATLAGNGTSFAITGDLPAGATATVTYTVTVKTADFGDGNLVNVVRPKGENPPTDCEPGDTTCTENPIPGKLDVVKSSDPEDGTTVAAGDTVKYSVVFTNTGGAPVAVNHTDYLDRVLDDADLVSGPEFAGADHGLEITTGNKRFTVTGDLPSDTSVTVTYEVAVKDSGFGDGILLNVVRPGTDEPPTGPCETDDALCTEHPVKGELVVKKTSNPATGTPVAPGDVITYQLSFTNTGGQPVAVNHKDDLTDVLDDATLTTQPTSSDPSLTVTPSPLGAGDTQFTVKGDVARESTVTVTYSMTVKDNGFGNSSMANCVTPNGSGGNTRAADDTCTSNPIPGNLSVVKSSDPADGTAVLPGSDVNYTLTFTNTGGKASAVDYTDLLADVLDDATLTDGPTSSDASLVATLAGDGQSFSVVGDLAGGETVTVKYTVKVDTDNFGDGVLGNVVVKTGDTPPTECLPGDELCTEHPVPNDLVVTKSSDPVSGTKVNPGDVIAYTLTFANGGGRAADVDYTDYLADVLDDGTVTTDPTSSNADLVVAPKPLGGADKFTVTGKVPGGKSYTVTYKVTVKDANFGDGQLDNFVRPSTDTPPTTDEKCEDDDALCTTHPIPGNLTVVKDSAPGSGTVVEPGSDVDYTLTFTNSGGKAVDVDYTDYLAELLDDATITSDPVSSDDSLDVDPTPFTGNKFTVTGSLGSEKTVTVKYTATVKTKGFGDGKLTNVVVEGDETPPPTCEPGSALCTEHPVKGKLEVAKSSDPVTGTKVKPGDKVAYTLTFANTGGTAMPVDYTDYLAKVLDDALLTTAPASSDSAALQIAMADDNQSFKVTGSVAKESVVTVTYEVTVKDDAFGDGDLLNFLRPGTTEPPLVCLPTDELCTEHPVPGILEVAKSSDPESGTEVRTNDEITYRLTFANSGGQSTAVDYTDTLVKVLDDAEVTVVPLIVGDANGLQVSAISNGTFTVTGDLTASKTVVVEYTVKVLPSAERGDSILDNYLMPGDEEPPATCDPKETECTTHPVGELSVSKSVDPATGSTVVPGQSLTYQVSFANTGATNMAVDYSDLLAGVLDDARLTKDPVFAGGDSYGLAITPAPFAGNRIDVDGSLLAGRTAVVTYEVKVKDDAADRGDQILGNFVVKGDDTPPPTCEDDGTLCTENPVGDFSVTKSSDPVSGTVVATGEKIKYTLQFNNVGAAKATVDYTDHLAKVLDDAELVSKPSFEGEADGLAISTVASEKFSVTGELTGRTSVKVVYTVQVKAFADRGDSVLDNFLVKGSEEPPATCTPQTPLCTEHPVGELAVSKSVDPASGSTVTAGQELTYRLTFVNRGAAAMSVDHTDHLAKVLDDAKVTAEPSFVGDAAGLSVSAISSKKFTVAGELAQGTTAVVEYKVKVLSADKRGDSQLDNFLVKGDKEPPSTCDDGDLCTENPVGEFSVTKTSDPKSGTTVKDGDTVSYTLTFTNTGATSHAVDYTDHMAKVLDDAILTKEPAIVGAAHGLEVSAVADKKFTVSGDLAGRRSVKVSYSVTVHDTGNGDNALTNFLVEGDAKPPAKCTSGTALCTQHPVLEPKADNNWVDGILPNTGGPAFLLLLAGLLALLAGVFVVGMGRRREE